MFIERINLIYNFGVILGVVPYLSPKHFEAKLHKLHAVVTAVLLFFATTYSIYARYLKQDFVLYGAMVIAIDVIRSSAMTMALCISVIKASVFNVETFKEFLKRQICTGQHKTYASILQLLFIHVVVVSLTIINIYLGIRVAGLGLYVTFLHLLINRYYAIIVMALIVNFVLILRQHISILNQRLERTQKSPLNGFANISKFQEEDCTWKKIKDIRRCYKKYSDFVRMFNMMFGWQMLLLTVSTSLECLETVNGLIVFFLRPDEANVFASFGVVGICFAWCAALGIMGIAIAVICDMATKEAQRTSTICYNLLLEVPALSTDPQDKILREELVLLAQQATHQCPYFSAAGFFKMDYTMLFGLVGVITSYVIVLIQINKK